jgi:hypothetical protein
MGHPMEARPHTLAQFARRAGISEGRARALYAATPSGLPQPDRTDADGRPLWWASTIDAWCAGTGRQVSEESLWLFRAPAATRPAAELRRGVVTLDGHLRQAFFAIVWDTAQGHVIYLQPLDGTRGVHRDRLAVAAAELVEPRWWPDAVVVVPLEEALSRHSRFATSVDVYRLETAAAATDRVEPSGRGGRRRWFQQPDAVVAKAQPRAVWVSMIPMAKLAMVIGRPVPVWLEGTATTANAAQVRSYTFTTADTTSSWPATEERLVQAHGAGMPGEFPAAFAALAADAADELSEVRAAHAAIADNGPGWYLVCRPARPTPPVELEQLITNTAPVTDTTLVGNELIELRELEGELDYEDPGGDVYAHAIELLEYQLRAAAKDAGEIRSWGDYVRGADDGWLVYRAPWEGSVVQAWQNNLSPIEDLDAALRLRRVRRLVGDHEPNTVQAGYREPDGRYVLVIAYANGECWSAAEWPASLQVVSTWTDQTVLAGDDPDSGAVTLLALTPDAGGRTRTDPVPLQPHSDREAFGYGYSGGTPITTYRALLRIGLGDGADLDTIHKWLLEHLRAEHPASQLWHTISTTNDPLRLPWPRLQLWARAYRKAATTR